jgi:hypothetical protein
MQCTTVLLLLAVTTRCSIDSDGQDYPSARGRLGLKDFDFIMKNKMPLGIKNSVCRIEEQKR